MYIYCQKEEEVWQMNDAVLLYTFIYAVHSVRGAFRKRTQVYNIL